MSARRAGTACVAATAAAAALVSAPLGSGAAAASRIVDRTVVCRPLGGGLPDPVRIVSVRAAPKDLRPAFKSAPYVSLFGDGTARSLVSAGARTGPGPQSHQRTGELWLNRTVCTRTSLRIPLSSKGLSGGATAAFSRGFDCDVPARILVRIRGVFTRPVTLRRNSAFPYLLTVKGRMTTASLAVATFQGRRPIAFASADDASGKAKLFIAPSLCYPD